MFVIRFALLSSLFYALNVSMIPLIYTFEASVFLFLFIRFGTTFCTSILITKSFFSFKKIKHERLGLWILVLSLLFGIQSWLYVEAVKYMSVGLASVSDLACLAQTIRCSSASSHAYRRPSAQQK